MTAALFKSLLYVAVVFFCTQAVAMHKSCFEQKTILVQTGENILNGKLDIFDDVETLARRRFKRFELHEHDARGNTILHYCMMHPATTVGHVKLFIARGAWLFVKNDEGDDPYHSGIACEGRSPNNELEDYFYHCDKKVIDCLHATMLERRLEALLLKQPWRKA